MSIDYFTSFTVPVRDRVTKKIVLCVQVYGLRKSDIDNMNSVPYRRALRNCGMNEEQYYVSIDDMIAVINGPGKDKWHRHVYKLN